MRYGLSLNIYKKLEKMEHCRDNVFALLEDLKNCSLLLETSDDEYFSIHDVVCEVGTRIIGKEGISYFHGY